MVPKSKSSGAVRVGIDTGGTFTDFIVACDGGVRVHKVLSTPRDPAEAVLRGLEELGLEPARCEITYGSTVATNALIERKGARTAFVTTAGVEDLLEIGRQNRPHIYDLTPSRPPPLVPRQLRFGVNERTLYDGTVLKSLNRQELGQLRRTMQGRGIESVAVCLLFGFVNPAHELAVAETLGRLGIPVSCSHQILPEHREYERASTTTVNAYVAPIMGRHLERLGRSVGSGRFRVMQSNGGSISTERAASEPVHTILSGPAGGVVAGLAVGRRAGFEGVITFDMGGTSTDVALCDGDLTLASEAAVGGIPVHVPMIDLHTVGAGGGSIARRDPGGALVVGPESAGADPGPICYGKGNEVTVTDANLALGRLDGRWFLGGTMELHVASVRRAMKSLASSLGVSQTRAAEGIIEVVNATMERAIRVISVERGHDPRRFTLVSFGGAGALHACELAERLAIPRVVVPNNAGIASALGMVISDVKRTYVATVMEGAEALSAGVLERAFRRLEREGRRDMTAEGLARADLVVERIVDCRYVGQSYELSVPYGQDYIGAFHGHHESTYGYARSERPVEVVAVRVHVTGPVAPVVLPKGRTPKRPARPRPMERKTVVSGGKRLKASVFRREELSVGAQLRGPAVVPEYSATTWVPPGWVARVDRYYNLLLERAR
jgi:N-methylhydantoinase A